MSFEKKKIVEERGQAVTQMHEMANAVKSENRDFSSEELQKYDNISAKVDEYDQRLATIERLDRVSSVEYTPEFVGAKAKGRVTQQDRDDAFRACALVTTGQAVESRYVNAAEKCGVNLNNPSIKVTLRAQTVGTAGEGGNLTDDSLMTSLEKSLLWHGGIRQACQVIRTATGSDLNWPTLDDTSNSASIVAENTAVSNTGVTFGTKQIKSYKWPSGVFPVSVELLQDSLLPISSIVGEALGERISRAQNTAYTTGTGSSQPEGLVTASTAGKTAAAGAAFTWDEIVDLVHSVDVAYRNSPSFGLMMHDLTFAELKKLEDSTGRPLYLPSIDVGGPQTFNGFRIHINNDMESTLAINNKIILAGDFSKGIVRDVADVEVMMLRERYADQLAVGFFAYARGDFKLINTAAVKHLKLAAA